MAGTLVIDTLKSSTTSPVAFQNTSGTAIGTLCRAWVNFVGSSGSINASFNVSSVTRNGTGDYTLNFTSSLADANYSGVITSGNASQSGAYAANAPWAAATSSAFRIGITTVTTTPQLVDAPVVNVAVFR